MIAKNKLHGTFEIRDYAVFISHHENATDTKKILKL